MQHTVRAAVAATLLAFTASAFAQADNAILERARAEKQPLLETLKTLTAIESGSRDLEGLAKIGNVVAERLHALGATVEMVEPADVYRMEDTPPQVAKAVRATFKGKGQKKLLMIAHMDTVYLKGMGEKQPFRVDGDKAYGLGIADDKQGIALILHALKIVKDTGFDEYGTITVLVNPDEEISTPGHRALITRLGSENDAVMSFEGGGSDKDQVRLATAGIAGVTIKVKGKASHAGSAPERGINAMVELANQILQTKDLSDPATGLKMNWTMAEAGNGSHNVIPEHAQAFADVRVTKLDDYDRIEREVRDRITHKIVPNAQVEMVFERRRPPLQTWEASTKVAEHAQEIYKEVGRSLIVDAKAEGGGTDAAFAALKTRNAVIERFGLQGFGAHSTEDEYILVSSIEPRLYLATRLIMDVSQGKVL